MKNLHRFLERFSPDQPRRAYAEEMWSLYESNHLEPDTELRGDYRDPEGKANTEEVLALIDDANLEEQARRDARGDETPVEAAAAPKPLREVVDFTKEARPRPGAGKRVGRRARPERPRSTAAEEPVRAGASVADGDAAPKKRRSRRRRKRSTGAGSETTALASQSAPTKTDKKTVGTGEANGPKRRRRRGRSGARTKSEDARAGAQGNAKRPARSATGARAGGAAGGTDRPSRRRPGSERPRVSSSRWEMSKYSVSTSTQRSV